MKLTFSIAALLFAFSLQVFADYHEADDMKGKKFEEAKTMMLEGIDKRMAHVEERKNNLTEMKSCVSGAADKPALKACRTKHREAMKAHKEAGKEMRAERKAMREQRKANRKNK
ncbi:MAG: hypothetical protein HRT45_08395 [Bdellovibrionales bacterium]|nr:hypothetical protein [Bdellovibrionales bacterium]